MRIVRVTFLSLLTLWFCAAASAALARRSFSLYEYGAELDHLSSLATQARDNPGAADAALDELRGDWTIRANGRDFKVDTSSMVDRFEALKRNPSDKARDELITGLNALKADAQSYDQPAPDSSTARTSLKAILARNEFHDVHGPTWWNRLKYRILMWIVRVLTRTFGSSAVPTIGRIFVWTLVGLAVVALAYFVYRTIRQNSRLESFIPQVGTISAKGWRIWMEEAQAAAARGLWRDAVHLAYWAGISFLETSGMWRPDKARTPREYLRLLPTGSEHRPQLSALTRNLELTWYGNKPAGPETFSETVNLLETLGCREV